MTTAHSVPTCDYCGLPLAVAEPRAAEADAGPQYCCFGCQFAASVAQAGGETGQTRWAMARLGLAIFFAMNVMMFTMALWSQDWPDPTASDQSATARLLNDLLRYLSLLFSLPVLILLGEPMVTSALAGLQTGRGTTDLLLMIGVAASFIYSAVAVWLDAGHVYFEVGCAVLVAVTLGRWLEATGKLKTTAALEALARLLPEQVRLETAAGERALPLAELRPGDRIRVLAGERIPADGIVRRGCAAVDEQIVTGESRPRTVELGDALYGGSLNLDGDLALEVTTGPEEGALQRIVASVRSAALAKGEYQRLADRLSAWFLPAVVIITLAALLLHAARGEAFGGLMAALAVLVIACPCALAVATPLAVWAALGRAARQQVLFRGGDALARLAAVQVLAFDKTGTLTTGDHQVSGAWLAAGLAPEEVARRLAPLAASSIHTHSRALAAWCSAQLSDSVEPSTAPAQFELHPGLGLRGCVGPEGLPVALGSPRFLAQSGHRADDAMQAAIGRVLERGDAIVAAGWEGRIVACFALREELRPEAPALVAWARRGGYRLIVLTGDHRQRAAALESHLGVEVRGELLPDEKLAAVRQLQHDWGPVAMIGDGANDAPALAGADVGIALGCGADVSRQTADVCLLASDLARLPWAIELARDAVTTIRHNLGWAVVYNVAGIGIAAAGWLHPAVAAAAMVVSSAMVVANSLRLAADENAAPRTEEPLLPAAAIAARPPRAAAPEAQEATPV